MNCGEYNFCGTTIKTKKYLNETSETIETKKKTTEQKLPILILQTLLYTNLVSVYPGTKMFSQKVV